VSCVLDASALLALVRDENGAAVVIARFAGSMISAVNLTEVVTRLIDLGDDRGLDRLRELIEQIDIRPFDAIAADTAANLRETTRQHGLSLGDRACLALAVTERRLVLTADRRMALAEVGVDIRLIR
jgi:PIN domain nuclease of toxin-antitoxin system